MKLDTQQRTLNQLIPFLMKEIPVSAGLLSYVQENLTLVQRALRSPVRIEFYQYLADQLTRSILASATNHPISIQDERQSSTEIQSHTTEISQ
jgi:hypothetical protein